MNENSAQNNRRLLEVIELLDSKYVEEMFDDLKVPRREDSRITRRPPVKHWKYLASLAACIVLFALAIPTINYVLPRLGIFIGGTAGAGTTDFTENSTLQTESDTDIESTDNSQTSNPNFQYSTVRIISDNNAFINPISVKIGYSLYKDDKSIWTEGIAGWQYIISNKDYKFENLPILTLDGDISSSAPENVSISNFQIFDSDWQRLDYTFVHLYELSLLPSGDYIVVGIEKEMIPYEQPHYVVGEYDYKLESSAAVFAISVTEQTYTNTATGDPDSDLPTGIRVWDWYHPDDSERYPYFSVSLPEFNNATIERNPEDCMVYVDGVHLLGGAGYGCSSFYLSDLTGDGYPELCFVMNAGSGIVDHRIVIIDYTTKETVFTAIGRMYRDYYLFLRNGVLCVKETEYAKQEPIRTGVLKHNGSEITIIWDSEVNATVDRDPVPQPGEPVS